MHTETNGTISILAREAATALSRLADAIDQRQSAPAPQPHAPSAAPSPQPAPAAGAVASFGRHKGAPLSTMPVADLNWYITALGTSLSDPTKAAYAKKNAADYEAAKLELARRG